MAELRQFFRVNATIPIFLRSLSDREAVPFSCRLDDKGFDKTLKKRLMRKINISGAGICFESDIPYVLGDIIEMRFMLEDVYPGIIAVSVEVIRVETGSKNYYIAVKYACIDERIRELIVRFVFQRERIIIKEKRVGWL